LFDYSLDYPFTVSKVLASHALSYALIAVIAGLLIGFGPSLIVWSWLHVPVLGFLAANVVASVVAADSTLALYGAHARMLGLATVFDWVVLYFSIVLLVRTRNEAIAVVACALGAAVAILGYELVQLLGKDPFSWNTDVTLRPFSTIGQPTSLAQYLSTLAVTTAALGFLARGLPRAIRVLIVVFAMVMVGGAAATATRSAVLGLVAGSAVFVLLVWTLHPDPAARGVTLAGAGAVTVALAGLLLFTPLGPRLAATIAIQPSGSDDIVAQFDLATDTRLALYRIAIDMVLERPLLGYGPDNFIVGVPRYRSDHEPYEVRQSLATSGHSWVTYVATSAGLIGLAAFAAAAIVGFTLVLRGGFQPLALVAAASIAAFLGTGVLTINDISTDWLYWASLATIAAVTARPAASAAPDMSQRKPKSPTVPRKKQSWSLAALCVMVGVALAFSVLPAWEAARANRSAEQARLMGRAGEAIDKAVHATQLDPRRAEYWHGLGLAYISAGRWADAGAAFDRAVRLAPYDVRNVGDLARAQLLLGSTGDQSARAKAMEMSSRAVQIDPNNPLSHLTRAVVMQSTGNLPEALIAVERALVLDPESDNGALYVTAAQIYIDSVRPSDAIRVAQQGLSIIPVTRTVALRYELARALVAMRRPADALVELDLALAIEPNNASIQQLKVDILATQSK